MNINRDKHNKYVVNGVYGPSTSSSTDTGGSTGSSSSTSSGSNTGSSSSGIGGGNYGGNGGGSSVISVQKNAFTIFQTSDGVSTIVQTATSEESTASIDFAGDDVIKVTIAAQSSIPESEFTSTTGESVYKISYGKQTVEEETQWVLELEYVSGTQLKPSDFDALKLFSVESEEEGSFSEVASFPSSELTIETITKEVSVGVTEDRVTKISVYCDQLQFTQVSLTLTIEDTYSTVLSFNTSISNKTITQFIADLSDYATKVYVQEQIDALVGAAPDILDTLYELANALGNDPNFATTITNMITGIDNRVDVVEADIETLKEQLGNISVDDAIADYLTTNNYAKKSDITWGNLSDKPSVFNTNIANISDLHSSWDAVLKAQKPAWLTTVSLATISDLHASWDALLKAAPSAYVTRWPTAAEVGALTQSTGDARYVKKTGDTMTGYLRIKEGDGNMMYGIQDASGNNAIVSYVGTNSYIGMQRGTNYLRSGATDLIHRKNGTDYKIWDSSNDGSGSGLDADLLDGLQASWFYQEGYVMAYRRIDASGLDQNTWYPVTFSISATYNVRIECRVALNSGTKPSWSTHAGGFSVRKIWEVNGSGWGTNPVNRRVLVSDYAFASTDPVRGINQNTNSSLEYVYVRGGGVYYFYLSHNIGATLHTSSYTSNNITIAPTTTAPAVISRNVAYVSDNVASATQLQTARTINGTAFNGTSNIVTSYWGTARNFYIRDHDSSHTGAAVSVNGSANEYLLLPSTITASLNGNATSASYWQTARTLTVSGDATGSVSIRGNANMSLSLDVKYATSAGNADTLDSLHASAFARKDQNPAVDLNTVNGNGIMTNPANANATTARHYPIQEAGTLFYGAAAYSSANQIYGTFSSNRWFFRGGGGSTTTKTAWKEMAFLTSNVASATKLQTARTIWGQSFNGTANVSGNMTGVTDINASGVIQTNGIITTRSGINVEGTGVKEYLKNSSYAGDVIIGGSHTSTYGNYIYLVPPDTNSIRVTSLTLCSAGSYTVRMGGDVYVTGRVTQASDIRLKTNISNLLYRGRLNPKTFIRDNKQQIGFIAQDVQKLYPEVVIEDNDENHYLSLSYSNMTAILSAQINYVEDEVSLLKKKIQELETRLSKYEDVK